MAPLPATMVRAPETLQEAATVWATAIWAVRTAMVACPPVAVEMEMAVAAAGTEAMEGVVGSGPKSLRLRANFAAGGN